MQTENFGLILNKNMGNFSPKNSLFKIKPEKAALCGENCHKKEGSL